MTEEQKNKKRECDRAWRLKNPEKCRQYARRHYRKYRERIVESARRVRKENPFESKRFHLRKLYGLSVPEYQAMVERQNNLCAICFKAEAFRSLSVDHDHQTGKVRELLCMNCNKAIGCFKEDVLIMESAIKYLIKHR